MLSIDLDFTSPDLLDVEPTEERVMAAAWAWVRDHSGVKIENRDGALVWPLVIKINHLEGSGGGWPELRFTAEPWVLRTLLGAYTGGDEQEVAYHLSEAFDPLA